MQPLSRHLITGSCALVCLACTTFGADFVVTSKSDSGAGTLRQAILDANASPGADRIVFNIGGGAPYNIALSSALPSLLDPVQVDATTQPGYTGTPLIALVGTSAGGGASGLTVETTGCEIRGFAIQRFRAHGIRIYGGGGHVVSGNFIGVATSGAAIAGNQIAGIEINNSANNTIGGTSSADRNIISGNETGLYINGLMAISNRIIGNFIGTDVTGTAALGNTNNGVLLYSTRWNAIGGSVPGSRNIISGNGQSGIYVFESLTTGNRVLGNFIGLSVTGQSGVSNHIDGVTIYNAPANQIGGPAPGEGNVISANRERGIYIINSGAVSNRIEGNLIGLAADGFSALGNRYSGIGIAAASVNTIGGTNSGARNVISGNQQSGIAIADAQSFGNIVVGNYIGTDRFGTNAVTNVLNGIVISQGTRTLIGGETSSSQNVISGNNQNGVYVQGGNTHRIAGNLIGTDATGTRALRNAQYGIRVDSAGNTIGGNSPTARNIISGNAVGVWLSGAAASNNVIAGNYIGSDASGLAAIPNNSAGLSIDSAPRNTIGGTNAADRNLISGNGGLGLTITGTGATANRLWGNWIGVDFTGAASLRNYGGGIFVSGAPGNFIGGSAKGAGNIVSGNSAVGIVVGDAGAAGNVLQGNVIGCRASGAGSVPNEWHGIELLSGAINTTVGGIALGEGNRIANAATWGYDGVRVRDGATGNSIRGNSIYSNGGTAVNGLAIDHGTDGVTLNDVDDADSGANLLQNFPVISAAGRYITTITGTLNSRLNATYTIDFYGTTSAEPGGYGEAQRWLGAATVTTAGNTANFSVTFTNLFGAGAFVAATATDAAGNTSELSAAVPVTSVDADADGLPDDYELAAGLQNRPTVTPDTDSDGDGAADLQEFAAGTNPLDGLSQLWIATEALPAGTLIRFRTVLHRTYRVEVASQVTGPWTVVADQIAGDGSVREFSHNETTGTRFYRVQATAN